jgi:hypothetical protein
MAEAARALGSRQQAADVGAGFDHQMMPDTVGFDASNPVQ